MKTDHSNNSNIIMAVILSAIVLLSWDYFMVPKTKPVPPKSVTTQTSDSKSPEYHLPQDENVPISQSQGFISLEQSLIKTPDQKSRLLLETPTLEGSIDLETGRFDDLTLKNYSQTLKSTEKVRLFAPSNTDKGFFAELGYTINNNSIKNWKVANNTLSDEKNSLMLEYKDKDIEIKRLVTIDDKYMFTITDEVVNKSSKSVSVTPYGLVKKNDPTFNKQSSEYVVHTGFIGNLNNTIEELKFTDIKDDGQYKYLTKNGWFGITEKYWAAILIPQINEEMEVRAIYNPYANQDGYQADYVLKPRILAQGEKFTLTNKLFSGAKSVSLIEAYQKDLKIENFDNLVDWGWFWFFTKPIFKGLLYIYSLVGNYGIAILILTLIIKALFFPLANKSYVAMSQMKKLQPHMEAIRKKHGDDPLKQQQELVALYKKEKVNPVAGCWPMLVQIPVFFALYKVLNVALELRHQPFFGWIQDLSAADPTNIFTLFGLLPITTPSFLHIGILPLIMGITMWFQQKLNPAPNDPIQARMMSLFPFIFTFILAGFSAGLVLYWTWNNILSIIQQLVILKKEGVPIEFHFGRQKSETEKG